MVEVIGTLIIVIPILGLIQLFWVGPRIHRRWTPWKASVKFWWVALWPPAVVTAIVFAIAENSENGSLVVKGLTATIAFALVISFGRATAIIKDLPKNLDY